MNQTETAPMTATPTSAPLVEWFIGLSTDLQADIAEMVIDTGYPLADILADIQDFIEQYGADAYSNGHYVTWHELSENGAVEGAIEAYVDLVGIDGIGGFEESYVGEYGSETEFAREYFDENHNGIDALEEAGVVIDWQATWDRNLRYNYDFSNGYVFNTNE
jgi:hypothetical protein